MKHFSQEEKEKQWTESHKSRVEREIFLHNLENQEEKENCFKNLTNREEKENFCLKILKIEKRRRNGNPISPCETHYFELFFRHGLYFHHSKIQPPLRPSHWQESRSRENLEKKWLIFFSLELENCISIYLSLLNFRDFQDKNSLSLLDLWDF